MAEPLTRILPLSRMHLQWRESGRVWRVLTESAATTTNPDEAASYEEDWDTWKATDRPVYAKLPPDAYETPEGWWMLYGELPAVGDVSVRLTDGRRPEVYHLGRIWAAEWSGPPVDAVVIDADQQYTIAFSDAGRMVPGDRYKS